MELAVVIAMTAILTALLLPALSSAKENSRRAVCKSDLHQLYFVFDYYADDNNGTLPSGADNIGNYHSIRFSDQTYTNLLNYAGGSSNIFYCPNLVYSAGPNGLITHDSYGYIIGYSYVAAAQGIQTTTKGVDYSMTPISFDGTVPTNILLADANYWSPGQRTVAPHTATGAVLASATAAVGSTAPVPPVATNSANLGAMGGNVELFDGSVNWHPIKSMQTHAASSTSDAFGNW